MKNITLILAFVTLTGCATVQGLMPSKWDVNQARSITDIQQTVINFDCAGDVKAQSQTLYRELQWLAIYNRSRGTADIEKVTEPFIKTVVELRDRMDKEQASAAYCRIKKNIMTTQSDALAKAIQGRF